MLCLLLGQELRLRHLGVERHRPVAEGQGSLHQGRGSRGDCALDRDVEIVGSSVLNHSFKEESSVCKQIKI